MKKKTSAKNPIPYGAKAKPAKTAKQYGTGIAKQDKKGMVDVADFKKTKATKQKLNQG